MQRLFAVLLLLSATATAQPSHVAPFVRDLGEARSLLALPDGTILVSRPSTFDVVALRDRDHDGQADEIRTAVSSVEGASGLAFHDGTLFVAGSKRIVAADRLPDGTFGPWREVIGDLPGAAGAPGRPIAVGPDGRLYAIVSEQDALWQIERDGTTRRVYARGVGGAASISFDADGTAHAVAAPGAGVTAGGATFTIGAQGTVLRSTSEPAAMISSSTEPTRTVLTKAFALGELRGAEAVIHDEEQDVYFVAGHGFISRVAPEGRLLERAFISEVKTPRGMAIRGVDLWVADGTSVRVFNRVTGHLVRTIDLARQGAVALGYAAVGGDDAVYVTDTDRRTGDGRIFRIAGDGDVELAAHGEELRSPAGIAWDGTRFLVAQAYGNEVVAWRPGHQPTAVLRGPGAYDGLTILPNGVVVTVSDNDGGLYVGTTGDLRPLFARTPAAGGIAFDRKRNRLLLPSAEGNWLEAWTLPPMGADAPKAAKERAMDMARLPVRSRTGASEWRVDVRPRATARVSTSPPPALLRAGSPDRSSTSP